MKIYARCKYAKKRYLHATKAIKGDATTSINPFNNWNSHFGDNCQICDTVKFLSKEVIGLQKFNKTHKNYPGCRPKFKKLWNQSVLKLLNQTILLDFIHPNIKIADLYEHTNTHISLCKCSLFADIIKRTVTTSICKHILLFLFCKTYKIQISIRKLLPLLQYKFQINNIKFSQH